MIYREAQTDENSKLAALGRELFIQTWADLYSPDDLIAYLDEVHSPAGVANDFKEGCCYWIAQDGNDWVGYCKAGPVHVPVTAPANSAELRQLYLLREYQGIGVADHLMSQFYQWANLSLVQHIFVSCWSQNHRALAFYRRHGFQRFGQYLFRVGNQLDDEYILYRPLGSDASWDKPTTANEKPSHCE